MILGFFDIGQNVKKDTIYLKSTYLVNMINLTYKIVQTIIFLNLLVKTNNLRPCSRKSE